MKLKSVHFLTSQIQMLTFLAHLRQRVKETEERYRNKEGHFGLRYMPDLLAIGGRSASGRFQFKRRLKPCFRSV